MSNYLKDLVLKSDSVSPASQLYVYKNYRFTVLSDMLLRVEADNSHLFCDEPTQAVINRNFYSTEFSTDISGSKVIIRTSSTVFCYDTDSGKMSYIILDDKRKIF